MRITILSVVIPAICLMSCGKPADNRDDMSLNTRFFTVTVSAIKGRAAGGTGHNNSILVLPPGAASFRLHSKTSCFSANLPGNYSVVVQSNNPAVMPGFNNLPAPPEQ